MASFTDEDERTIIEKCKADNETHGRGSGIFTCALGSESYKVKYGVSETLANRVAIQPFLYGAARKANNIRIPELLHHFKDGGRTYLVMELIEFTEVYPSNMDSRIEDALWWLSTFVSDKLGPPGGECIIHEFFNEGVAPEAYESVEALEIFIETGRKRVYGHEHLEPVTFKDEKLMLVQADMDEGHFRVDKKGNTVIMGFRSMSFLPHSFGRHTLTSSVKLSFNALPDKLQWLGDSNMETMGQIAANLGMSADPSLGIDKYGKRKKIQKTRSKKTRVTAAVEGEGDK